MQVQGISSFRDRHVLLSAFFDIRKFAWQWTTQMIFILPAVLEAYYKQQYLKKIIIAV